MKSDESRLTAKRLSLIVASLFGLALLLTGGLLFVSQEAVIAAGPDQVTVRARGNSGTEQMELHLNGEVAARWTATTEWTSFTHVVDGALTVRSAEVHFVNDGGAARDLYVDYLDLAGTRLQSEHSSTRSTGTFVPGAGCVERSSISNTLHCAGSFSYAVPSGTVIGRPSSAGELVQFRARGTSGAEEIHLRINGKRVRAFTAGEQWETFVYDAPAGGSVISAEVAFVNDGPDRDLRVDWLAVDGLRYQSEDATIKSAGSRACDADSSEWLYCNGWIRYAIGTPAATSSSRDIPNGLAAAIGDSEAPSRNVAAAAAPAPSTTAAPAPAPAPAPAATPAPAPVPTTTAAPAPVRSGSGRYSIAEVIDGTIGAGDGSNPNEEAPMGRHDAPLALPQGWNWTQGPTRNTQWGQLGTGGSRFVEWRCAVVPESGHTPSVPFRINVQSGAYYQFANGDWNKAFDVDLTGGNHGGYLGTAGRENQNPFDSGGHGQIQWRREADGSFSAPWNPSALMMHFWAGQRQAPAPGQTAEFLTSEVRLQQPDGQTVDLSQVRVLFQCGVDYYSVTGGQGTKVPGPGIAKYHRATSEWQPGLWVTLPGSAPAGSVGDFATWLGQNTPPRVG